LHTPLWNEVRGDEFAGHAIALGESEAEPETSPALENLLTRLRNLPMEDSKQREKRNDLVGTLQAAIMEAEAFLTTAIQERNGVLEEQLEEVRKQGRAQQKVVARLDADLAAKHHNFHKARENAKWRFEELKDVKSRRLSKWASREDRDQLQQEIRQAEVILKQANAEAVKATNARNEAAEIFGQAEKKMAEIEAHESRLRGELSGRIYYDPETALPIQPR
jgi:chromosome segregation ATPase